MLKTIILFIVINILSILAINTDNNIGNYYLSENPYSWDSAKLYCENGGMKLLSITTSQKDNDVVALLDSAGVNRVWTSGFDGPNDGKYIWASIFISFDYTNWIKGITPRHPSNNCVFTGTKQYWSNYDKSGWDIENCDTSIRFICEY